LLVEGKNATKTIDNLLGDNITASLFKQGVPGFLKSQQGRLLNSAIEIAVQDRTRIETGAALQPSELKSTAKRYMPRAGDTVDTAIRRLKPLYDFFEGSLNVADPTGTHRQRIASSQTSQEKAQLTLDAIAEAKKLGLV
jgi:folate-binding Fe-S cluster repair protein YgfZ